ncbi:phosphoglucosamine mutase [Halobacteriovorax marinus]|uniref:phosphoglucosamine mutase n=1 Tax=Halobacteriovorax marinus TaxID=97084 RepID=UPI000BC35AD3|nr:phosphoglucosamine mutase [Halobacteriovorax marinus]ATH08257.1 phosphoglucosamine mutase [Halobacteriovorax marinus]
MSERKLFGTDGIRGKANIYPMTPEIATALGRAVTHYFQGHTKRKKPLIIVGKDTRLSCYMFEQAFAAGVCSQGGEVILTGPLPTPGVAFVTESMRADAGVMISASHNAYSDNGIKIFDSVGNKLPDEVELELEELVLNLQLMPVKIGGELGNAKRLKEVFGRYLVNVKSTLDNSCKLDNMRVVLDCANGAGYKVAPMMFDELGAEVISLGVNPNGQNINSNCGSLHPELACEHVKKYRADIGICLDGDADRLTVIDHEGEVVNGDALIGLFAKFLLDTGKLKKGDTVVGTVMSNLGLENYIKSLGLKFHRTKVGDRYIVEYMRDHKCILGGEPSGHVIFGEYATTGDGCLAALKAIEAMKFYDKSIKELVREVSLYPQLLMNKVVKEKVPFKEIPVFQKELKAAEKKLGDKGRVLVRYSGTEPLARVMVEGEKLEDVHTICENLVKTLSKEIGS